MERVYRCEVLSADMVPISIIKSTRALTLFLLNRVYILENHDHKIRSVDREFPCPSVVCHKIYHNLPNYYHITATLNLENLRLRDRNTCQYCGRAWSALRKDEFWTVDHVLPQSKGGENRWENVVLSCNTCNNKKADNTPEEAGMEIVNKAIVTVPTRKHIELLKRVGNVWTTQEQENS